MIKRLRNQYARVPWCYLARIREGDELVYLRQSLEIRENQAKHQILEGIAEEATSRYLPRGSVPRKNIFGKFHRSFLVRSSGRDRSLKDDEEAGVDPKRWATIVVPLCETTPPSRIWQRERERSRRDFSSSKIRADFHEWTTQNKEAGRKTIPFTIPLFSPTPKRSGRSLLSPRRSIHKT